LKKKWGGKREFLPRVTTGKEKEKEDQMARVEKWIEWNPSGAAGLGLSKEHPTCATERRRKEGERIGRWPGTTGISVGQKTPECKEVDWFKGGRLSTRWHVGRGGVLSRIGVRKDTENYKKEKTEKASIGGHKRNNLHFWHLIKKDDALQWGGWGKGKEGGFITSRGRVRTNNFGGCDRKEKKTNKHELGSDRFSKKKD